jgi:outer membrane protein OmpA-like peptidoglycan-associated protein
LLLLTLWPVAAMAFEDTDGDELDDAWELLYFPDLETSGRTDDPDGDGWTNHREAAEGTNPTESDTDGDLLIDSLEAEYGTDPLAADTDGDDLTDYVEIVRLETNPLAADTDGGGIWDGAEVRIEFTNPNDPFDDHLDQDQDGLTFAYERVLGTSDLDPDSDADGLLDGEEDANHNGQFDADLNENGVFEPALGDETDPLDPDTDHDGLPDGWEVNVFATDPYAVDSDGDGLEDGAEVELARAQYPCLDPSEPDSDFDTLTDGQELGMLGTDPCSPDTDGDGVYDPVEMADGTDASNARDHEVDTDGDGLSDVFEAIEGLVADDADGDGDGIDDGQEVFPLADRFVTDALDADSDDDGLLDGRERGVLRRGDVIGGTSPLAFDTDQDGLGDGQERGLAAPQISQKHPEATVLAFFRPDVDPDSTTSPLLSDSDFDGLLDGHEDADHNGRVDATETDPGDRDTDDDGLDDGWEVYYADPANCAPGVPGLDPLDPDDALLDLDEDGLPSLTEYQVVLADGTPNRTVPCDPDSDDDGVLDGVELQGRYGGGRGSNPNAPDTDGDGLPDGIEDADRDGRWTPGLETDPNTQDTDGDGLADGAEDADGDGEWNLARGESDPRVVDTDQDGLGDGDEIYVFGTNPVAEDTDLDGLHDGLEAGVRDDADPNTRTNPRKADTDGDGLADGLEDRNRNGRIDAGETNPKHTDTDRDRLTDGVEDANLNGVVDAGETDPTIADTDGGGTNDGDEVNHDGTDPLDPDDDYAADPDGDGLDNRSELGLGTDRFNADSDGDRIHDGDEALLDGRLPDPPLDTDADGYIDALDDDSDGDGIPDGIEAGDLDLETPPVDTDGDGAPDFRDLDADNGGVPDALEVRRDHTNPLDPADDGRGWLEGDVRGGPGCSAGPGLPTDGWPLALLLVLGLSRLRRRRQPTGLLLPLLLAALVLPGLARAQHPDALMTAIDVNPFRLDPAGLGFMGTTSGRVLNHLQPAVQLTYQTVNSPLVLRNAGPTGPDTRTLVGTRQQLDVGMAIGLFHKGEVAVSLPIIMAQDAQLPGLNLGAVSSQGVGDLLVRPKFALVASTPFSLSLSAGLRLPTGADEAYMGTGGTAFEPRVSMESRLGALVVAANVGTRFESERTLLDLVDGNDLLLGFSSTLQPQASDWSLGLSGLASSALNAPFDAAAQRRAELLVGAGYTLPMGLGVHTGVGAGLLPGATTPTWRGIMSLRWSTPIARSAPRFVEVDPPPASPDPMPQSDPTPEPIAEQPPANEDPDADGIVGVLDQCPELPEDVDGDRDDDGCPDTEVDSDSDSIVDGLDQCPDDPEDLDGVEDEDGCPDHEQEAVAELQGDHIVIDQRIRFALAQAKLAGSRSALRAVLKVLEAHPKLKVHIEGHTDAWGSDQLNKALSVERARTVQRWLVEHARNPAQMRARFTTHGYGEARPRANNWSKRGRAKNRRVEFVVVDEPGADQGPVNSAQASNGKNRP